MKKRVGIVSKAKEYYLKRGEYVVTARKAKRIQRAIARQTNRR
jgi:hypothetical protein